MFRRVRKVVAVLAIAVCGLVVALQLPASAKTARALISGSDISDHSISGVKLHNNTLTGKQIKESSLGTVPEAKTLPKLKWHTLSLASGWEDDNGSPAPSPSYAVDAQGIIHLRGAIEGTSGTTAFTLPSSLRPSYDIYLSIVGSSSGSSENYLYVEPNATVYSNSSYASLDGVTWAK